MNNNDMACMYPMAYLIYEVSKHSPGEFLVLLESFWM